MVILVRAHLLINNKVIIPGKLEARFESPEEVGFDINNPSNWFKWLNQNFSDYSSNLIDKRTGKEIPVMWHVFNWGGYNSYVQYFPGRDPKTGEKRYLKDWGRLK